MYPRMDNIKTLKKKKYRNEWKYSEDETDLEVVKKRISNVFTRDSHAKESGKYEIHSLYFDDYKDTCARENVAGEGKRFKYRIRYYGNNSSKLWLEKKEKYNSFCHKRKCSLTVDEYYALVQGNVWEIFWESNNRLLKEFCIDIITKRFVPRVIINYEREAFVEKIMNIRITFDYNVSASGQVERFLQGDYLRIPILEKKKHVLEVKFDDVLPSHVKNVLQANMLGQRSFSKYYLGRIALQDNNEYTKRF